MAIFSLALASGCDSQEAPGGTDSGFVTSGTASIRWYLDKPAGSGPFPTIVYGGGSGDVSAHHASTIRYARIMNELGFAVVRFDKRGTGDSTGEIPSVSTANSESTIHLLANDMMAVFDDVILHDDVDTQQVGLMGASQANWYLPPVAQQRAIVDFMIVVSGGVLPVGFKNRFEELTRIQGHSNEDAAAIIGLYDDFQGDIGFSQLPILEQLGIPMLYLVGDDDRGFPLEANRVEFDRLKQQGVNLQYVIYPGGDHLLPGEDIEADINQWLDSRWR